VALEVVHVAMFEDRPLRLGKPDPIDDRRVVELIADDHVALFDQDLQHPQVRREPGLEDEGGLRVLELGQLGFQLLVDRHRSRDGANGACTHPPTLGRRDHGFLQAWMRGQAQVVVG